MKTISLTKGQIAIVDDEDFIELSKVSWYAHKPRHTYYANRMIRENKIKKTITMQNSIIDCPEGKLIDHINGNGLDNRKANLRVCTWGQNGQNKTIKYKGVSSMYQGVSIHKGELYKGRRYKSYIVANICYIGKQIFIGQFKTEKEAAEAYDRKAIELYGEHAKLNFPKPRKRRHEL